MPQSSIHYTDEIPEEDMKEALEMFEGAQKLGMEWEWFTWFLHGLKQGMGPKEAAINAAIEWDL